MNNEFINKAEAIETAQKLSKKNSNFIYVILSGCSYFVTDSIIEANNGAHIARFKKGEQIWPVPQGEKIEDEKIT